MTRPNVLLVVMDSVRARNTSLHGHENETTPFLESYAERATVYENARAPGSWSLPSHASVFTGLAVAEHGVVEPGDAVAPGHTVFEHLGEEGYETGVFSENPWLTAMDAGLAAGFGTVEGARNLPFPGAVDPVEFTAGEGHGNYVAYLRRCLADDTPVRSLLNGVVNKLAWDHPRLVPERFAASAPADTYADLFLDWAAERDGPWAACINFMDAHAPYEPDERFDRWGGPRLRDLQGDIEKLVWSFHGGDRPWWQCRALEALYDGTIRQVDAAVERVVSTLERRGDLEDTLVVVTSDHGEGFGEPSRLKPDTRVVGHVEGVHEALLHVPLVVDYPDGTTGDSPDGAASDSPDGATPNSPDGPSTDASAGASAERVWQPATLARFPAVVESALEGERSGFVPDGPVVASSNGLTEPNMRLAEEYCGSDELWRFRGEMRAVYEGTDPVTKWATWEDAAVGLACVDAQTHYEVEGDARDRVAAAYDALSPANVRRTGDLEDVDEEVERRLRELGYAD